MIDTSNVKGRRTLHFNAIDEVLADVDKIVASANAGTLRQVGNWSPGQVMGHVGTWIDYGWNGYPFEPPPFFIRWILKAKKDKYLREGMPAGVKIPGVKDGTFAQEEMSIDKGAAILRKAFGRLKSGEPATHDSPAFGPMSHEARVELNLRHAELHLSFLIP